MRPRVFPAEDGQARVRLAEAIQCFNEAAGIPRGRLVGGVVGRRTDQASMRPRVFPAEDPFVSCLMVAFVSCFNEAAGIPRGRLKKEKETNNETVASMRPRVFPAEDSKRKRRPTMRLWLQ